MKSEIRRVGSNYARLFAGALCGLLTTRILVEFGIEVFNLYTLVILGVGVGAMAREYIRATVTPHLAKQATDKADPSAFSKSYSSAFGFSSISAVFGAVALLVLAANISSFAIGTVTLYSAQLFIIMRAISILATITMTPYVAALPIFGRFEKSNAILFSERLIDVSAAAFTLLLTLYWPEVDVIICFGLTSTILTYGYLGAVISGEKAAGGKLVPSIRRMQPILIKKLFVTSGFVLLFVISMNLFIRFDTLYINANYGTVITVAFGVTVQLMGYARQFTAALSNNLDAVIATQHVESTAESIGQMHKTVQFNTYAQSFFSLMSLSILALNVKEIILLWLGNKMDNPTLLQAAEIFTIIAMIAMSFRAFSESFISSLQGIGRNRGLALTMVISAIANVVILLAFMGVAVTDPPYLLVVLLFAVAFCVTHAIAIPLLFSHAMNFPIVAIYGEQARLLFVLMLSYAAGYYVLEWMAIETGSTRIIISSMMVVMIFGAELGLKIWMSRRA